MRMKILAPLTLMILASCSSEDLGDEKPIEVSIDITQPTWDGGIKELLEKKCDSCHGSYPSKFTPANASQHILNFSLDENLFKTRHLDSVSARVFSDSTSPMPPNFATPLTANERLSLQNYISQAKQP